MAGDLGLDKPFLLLLRSFLSLHDDDDDDEDGNDDYECDDDSNDDEMVRMMQKYLLGQ